MKRLIIVVLILVVVGAGFYFGYQKAIAPNHSSHSSGDLIHSKSIIVTVNANTKELTWITKLDMPTVVFEQDSLNRKLIAIVSSIPNNISSQNKKEYRVNLQLVTLPQTGQVNADIRVQENQSFSIMMGSNNSSFRFEGMVIPVENDQVKVSLKIK
jgi:hypothetical protein